LGLSRVQMSYIFSAFTLGCAAFEIPTAYWGEKIGTRKVLARIVAWWSAFTLGTAAAWSYGSLAIIRFLFGVGEAGAWPNVAKTFSHWIPAAERGRTQGIFFMGAHLAGGVTPLMVMALVPHVGWRGVFAVFGMLGYVWTVAWLRWFRDDPALHPEVGKEELALIEAGRRPEQPHAPGVLWRALPRNRNLLALCAGYFANGYGFYFLITWLPTYLQQQRGFAQTELSFFAGLPLMLSVFADLFGGIATDWTSARFGLRTGRSGVGAISYFVAAIAVLIAAYAASGRVAAVLIAVAAAASMFPLAASWATCMDLGGRHAGVMSAAMNTAGQVGGILSPILLAYLVEWFADWKLPLLVMCGLYAMAATAWLLVNPEEPIPWQKFESGLVADGSLPGA
jgi:MFS family permease